MSRLHLVRHGATESSGQTYAGRRNVALTTAGRAEAEAVAEALAGLPVGVILSSPLSRAMDTARPLAGRLGLAVLIEPSLTEFDFGALEGRDKSEVGLNLRKAHMFDPVPGGESLADVWRRAGEFAERVRREIGHDPSRDVVCVGHFWINRLIHGRCLGLTFDAACRDRSYRPETGSIRTVDLGSV